MKTKLPPGPIRPPGNYFQSDCVPSEIKRCQDLLNTSGWGDSLRHLHLSAARRGFVFVIMTMRRRRRPVADGGGDVVLTGVKWQLGLVVVFWGAGGEFQAVGDLALGHRGDARSYIFNNYVGMPTRRLVTARPTCHGRRPRPAGATGAPPARTSII